MKDEYNIDQLSMDKSKFGNHVVSSNLKASSSRRFISLPASYLSRDKMSRFFFSLLSAAHFNLFMCATLFVFIFWRKERKQHNLRPIGPYRGNPKNRLSACFQSQILCKKVAIGYQRHLLTTRSEQGSESIVHVRQEEYFYFTVGWDDVKKMINFVTNGMSSLRKS